MPLTCRGVCNKHKSEKPGKSRYAAGQKLCNNCNVFIEWEGFCCPCCGLKLRSRPRNSKYKDKLGKKISIMRRI